MSSFNSEIEKICPNIFTFMMKNRHNQSMEEEQIDTDNDILEMAEVHNEELSENLSDTSKKINYYFTSKTCANKSVSPNFAPDEMAGYSWVRPISSFKIKNKDCVQRLLNVNSNQEALGCDNSCGILNKVDGYEFPSSIKESLINSDSYDFEETFREEILECMSSDKKKLKKEKKLKQLKSNKNLENQEILKINEPSVNIPKLQKNTITNFFKPIANSKDGKDIESKNLSKCGKNQNLVKGKKLKNGEVEKTAICKMKEVNDKNNDEKVCLTKMYNENTIEVESNTATEMCEKNTEYDCKVKDYAKIDKTQKISLGKENVIGMSSDVENKVISKSENNPKKSAFSFLFDCQKVQKDCEMEKIDRNNLEEVHENMVNELTIQKDQQSLNTNFKTSTKDKNEFSVLFDKSSNLNEKPGCLKNKATKVLKTAKIKKKALLVVSSSDEFDELDSVKDNKSARSLRSLRSTENADLKQNSACDFEKNGNGCLFSDEELLQESKNAFSVLLKKPKILKKERDVKKEAAATRALKNKRKPLLVLSSSDEFDESNSVKGNENTKHLKKEIHVDNTEAKESIDSDFESNSNDRNYIFSINEKGTSQKKKGPLKSKKVKLQENIFNVKLKKEIKLCEENANEFGIKEISSQSLEEDFETLEIKKVEKKKGKLKKPALIEKEITEEIILCEEKVDKLEIKENLSVKEVDLVQLKTKDEKNRQKSVKNAELTNEETFAEIQQVEETKLDESTENTLFSLETQKILKSTENTKNAETDSSTPLRRSSRISRRPQVFQCIDTNTIDSEDFDAPTKKCFKKINGKIIKKSSVTKNLKRANSLDCEIMEVDEDCEIKIIEDSQKENLAPIFMKFKKKFKPKIRSEFLTFNFEEALVGVNSLAIMEHNLFECPLPKYSHIMQRNNENVMWNLPDLPNVKIFKEFTQINCKELVSNLNVNDLKLINQRKGKEQKLELETFPNLSTGTLCHILLYLKSLDEKFPIFSTFNAYKTAKLEYIKLFRENMKDKKQNDDLEINESFVENANVKRKKTKSALSKRKRRKIEHTLTETFGTEDNVCSTISQSKKQSSDVSKIESHSNDISEIKCLSPSNESVSEKNSKFQASNLVSEDNSQSHSSEGVLEENSRVRSSDLVSERNNKSQLDRSISEAKTEFESTNALSEENSQPQSNKGVSENHLKSIENALAEKSELGNREHSKCTLEKKEENYIDLDRSHDNEIDIIENDVQNFNVKSNSPQTKVKKENEKNIENNYQSMKIPFDMTQIYAPNTSDFAIGNLGSINVLIEWLTQWKDNRNIKIFSENSWDSNSNSEEDDSDATSNTVLITGPNGVGKSAIVYALAQQFGYKVLEINASSSRGGKQVLVQLSEATQSHNVSIAKSNSQNISDSPQLIVENGTENCDTELNKTMALILIEDIDLVFENYDEGFLSAVNNLMSTSKRPIILTSNCENVKIKQHHLTVKFSQTRADAIAQHLQLMCLVNGVFASLSELELLVRCHRNDVRKCISDLQFWIGSSCTSQIHWWKVDDYKRLKTIYETDYKNDISIQEVFPDFKKVSKSVEVPISIGSIWNKIEPKLIKTSINFQSVISDFINPDFVQANLEKLLPFNFEKCEKKRIYPLKNNDTLLKNSHHLIKYNWLVDNSDSEDVKEINEKNEQQINDSIQHDVQCKTEKKFTYKSVQALSKCFTNLSDLDILQYNFASKSDLNDCKSNTDAFNKFWTTPLQDGVEETHVMNSNINSINENFDLISDLTKKSVTQVDKSLNKIPGLKKEIKIVGECSNKPSFKPYSRLPLELKKNDLLNLELMSCLPMHTHVYRNSVVSDYLPYVREIFRADHIGVSLHKYKMIRRYLSLLPNIGFGEINASDVVTSCNVFC